MKRKKPSKNLDIARMMPPLPHGMPDKDFDIEKSEAVKWLLSQEDIMQWVWGYISNNGWQNPYLKFNPETRTWQGVDYED